MFFLLICWIAAEVGARGYRNIDLFFVDTVDKIICKCCWFSDLGVGRGARG